MVLLVRTYWVKASEKALKAAISLVRAAWSMRLIMYGTRAAAMTERMARTPPSSKRVKARRGGRKGEGRRERGEGRRLNIERRTSNVEPRSRLRLRCDM